MAGIMAISDSCNCLKTIFLGDVLEKIQTCLCTRIIRQQFVLNVYCKKTRQVEIRMKIG